MQQWSGRTTAHSHKFDDWEQHGCNGNNSLKKVWFFDAQWSDCPVEVETEVKQLWREYALGNDHFIIQTSIKSLEEMHTDEDISTELLRKFILEKEPNIKNDELIIIHWWW